ncbi:MAG TPA: aldo/keto reductase [Nitrospira sp.]|nr:aldo/keto reductase [Nitrospira sp.]
MSASSTQRPPNRLIHETSPYLLQHAHNPVDWYPWGPEALAAAKERNCPILLSIGYSACHWCHVMERESFENETIAALMNRWFVCIKVDREERPDLDEIYMAATIAMNQGQGGWPMTVFLTPDQQPFFAGTYFPPEGRWGRPGFAEVLKKIAEVWRQDPQRVTQQARDLTGQLQREWQTPAPVTVHEQVLEAVVPEYRQHFDERYGGFGPAPKFPPAAGLSLLLRCHRRTGDPMALHMVKTTLDAMAAGGIYDHIGGGFARYSTDERWLVPHFEKMLYDNALLAKTYLEAFQVTGAPAYRDIVTDVLDYILREMTDAQGGFYSATDADSEGQEGKFFVWTPEEVARAVGDAEDARRICAVYDISVAGNWEHKSIPNRMRPIDDIARELSVSADELNETIRRLRPILYEARKQRVAPGLDDKIITAWNGMMLSAMAEAARVLGRSDYLAAAHRAADFLLRVHRMDEDRLYRTSRHGRANREAVLEDYAFLGEGLVDLYEAGGKELYLDAARRLAERLIRSFQDVDHGGFFTTAKDHEALIVRGREGADGATPSGNAVAAMLLARLSFHLDRAEFREAAAAAIRAYGRHLTRYPRGFAKSLAVVDFVTEGPVELALVGASDDPAFAAIQDAIRPVYLPNRILAVTDRTNGRSGHPLLAGKQPVDGKPALYICRNFACQQPLTDPSAVTEALREASGRSGHAPRGGKLQGRLLEGRATVEGTARYAARVVNAPRAEGRFEYGFTRFGRTALTVSRLGFGCYRVDTTDPEHATALGAALESGVNLIDTSANYMDGDSERLVGSVVRGLAAKQSLSRDEIIVISKIGYVQGQNLKEAERRERSGHPYPEMVKYGEGIWHCIHPEFLADQLDASLDRLNVATLDVCLLHNPEYFLSEAAQRGEGQLEKLREEFYGRIERAFAYLERQVAAGRLSWYGVSSNTVGRDAQDPESTSLFHLLSAAARAAASCGVSQHHFAVLQCPMNLFEHDAWSRPNTGPNHDKTVLALGQQEDLAVMVNRPLNAMPRSRAGMLRLADVPLDGEAGDFPAALRAVADLEDEYRSTLAPAIPHGDQGLHPKDFFNWAEELGSVRGRLHGLEHWEQIEHQMIAPHVNQVLQAIPRLLQGAASEQWVVWRDRYIPRLLALLGLLRREAAEKSRARTRRVAAVIDPLLPESKRRESLSRKALWILGSTPGVTSVLNGMRTVRYVKDSTALLGWEPSPDAAALYRAMDSLSDL